MEKFIAALGIASLIVFLSVSYLFSNHPPSEPTNPYPEDGAMGVATNVTLKWEATDEDGDTLTFDIYFGKEENPPLAATELTKAEYTPGKLEEGVIYYWKVVAKDGKGGIIGSKVWKFETVKRRKDTISQSINGDIKENKDVHYLAIAAKDGVLIIDVKVPENPKIVGQIDIEGSANDAKVSGNYLYIAAGRKGLLIFDISDLKNPRYITQFDTNGYANGIYISQQRVYIADGKNGLLIVDITNPRNPRNVGHFNTYGYAYKVYVYKGYAYIADRDRLMVIDVRNVKKIKKVGMLYAYEAKDVYVKNGYAFVVRRNKGLTVIDADPRNLKEVECLCVDSSVKYTYVSSKFAYIITNDNKIYIINIEVPEKLKIVKTIDVNHEISAVYPVRNYIYAFSDKILILDPNKPSSKSVIKEKHLGDSGTAWNLYVYNNYAYIANGYNGVVIVDIEDPIHPKRVAHIDVKGWVEDIYVDKNKLYITNGYGLLIFDVNDLKNPKKIRYLYTGRAYKVYVSKSYGYIEAGGNGIIIVDVSNPENPKKIGEVITGGQVYNLLVSNNYLYVIDLNKGFLVIDISSLTSPNVISQLKNHNGNSFLGLYKLGNYVYLTCAGNLITVDISNPNDLKEVSVISSPYHPIGVYAKNNYIFVADHDGLSIVDVTNPNRPKLIGHLRTDGESMNVIIKNNYAYIADGWNGLVIADITDPTNPKIVSDMFWPNPVAVFGF